MSDNTLDSALLLAQQAKAILDGVACLIIENQWTSYTILDDARSLAWNAGEMVEHIRKLKEKD